MSSEPSDSRPITAHEAKCIRIALAVGDPAGVDLPDDDLERAKGKLLAIERMDKAVIPTVDPDALGMCATHRDGRAVYCQQGDRYESIFEPGATLDDVLLLEERTALGDWRICYDGRRFVTEKRRS